MRNRDDVEREIRDLFNKREEGSERKLGGAIFLTVCLLLGGALAVWPFVKSVSYQSQSTGPPLYNDVPAAGDIVPASYSEETIDIFFFTGCAHQHHVKPCFHPPVTHLTEGV